MVPIEYFMLTLWGTFAIVGLARRFPRELGATVAFVGMLLFFDLVGDRIGGLAYRVTSALGFEASRELVSWFVISAVIVGVVTITYVGETLVYSGEWPPNQPGGAIAGAVVDMTTGLLNGWIVVGTWWWFANDLGYPMQSLGWYVSPLSSLGQRLVAYTPPAVIPEAYATWILAGTLLALLALKFLR